MPRFRDGAAVILIGATALAFAPARSFANEPAFDVDAALATSQAAVGNTLADLTFTDTRRRTVRLGTLIDRPTVISLIYTSCLDFCPTVSENLSDAVDVARDLLGDDAFRVVTVGFDARNDTPVRMRDFAASRGLNVSDWIFLSGDAPSVDRLSQDLGFIFAASPQGFDHMAQVSVIDGQGKLYRQIYGAVFDAPLLVEPLKQLIYGGRIEMTSIDGLVNRIRLYCTLYDAASGKYRFDYSLVISIVLGGLSMAMIGGVLVRAAWQARATRRIAPGSHGNASP